MDTVTYPHESVAREIADGFVAFKLDMLARHPDFKAACAGGRVSWGPALIVADSRGGEIRRWIGWLPPADFVAELRFCRAMAAFNRGRFGEAATAFAEIAERDRETAIRPEALYWQGCAAFLAGPKDWDALRAAWQRLQQDHPDHRFSLHASVINEGDVSRTPV